MRPTYLARARGSPRDAEGARGLDAARIKGYRGRLAIYVPPLLEALGKVELEHNPKNNRFA